jgi:lysylphosphatidylglycerol synthetase-like protein (DUF2156 family)
MAASRVYRAALRCYPASFRHRYGDDLVAVFEDLRADRGIRVACWRTFVDLIVTIPNYRLESVMSDHQASLTIATLIVMLTVAAIATLAVGAWPLALLVLVAAAVLLANQRHSLARNLRSDKPNKRRRLLMCASLAIAAFACLVGLYLADLGDDHVSSGALMVYNTAGLFSLASAVVLTIVGLRTHHEWPLTSGPHVSAR